MTDAPEMSDVSGRREPLVSIIIPFYRQEDYLRATVESARRQTYGRTEILVVDDGSPVAAGSVLGAAAGVTVVRTENGGVAAARNRGFAESRGEFLVFLDADDVLEADAVERHLLAFRGRPAAGMSFGAVRTIDAKGNAMSAPRVCEERRNYVRTFLCRNAIACPGAVMLRREVFAKVGGFDKLPFQAEDYLLYLKIVTAFDVVRHTGCVVAYRRHERCASSDKDAMRRGRTEALRRIGPRLAPGDRAFLWCVRAARAVVRR